MSKKNKIIYWIATLWLSLGMTATGIVQILSLNGQGGKDMMESLGYPDYLLIFLGICKILGVIVILAPKVPILKEWAYAGFTFLMTGAIYSHIANHDAIVEIFPALLLLILTLLSWYYKTLNKKISRTNPVT